jgi:hypothetical protein
MMPIARRLTQALLLALPVPALAAPFCVYNEAIPYQCIYYDAGSCNKRATQINGYCTVNTASVSLPPSGSGRWCLVTSSMASLCGYAAEGDCRRDASRQQAACIRAPRQPAPNAAVDPYQDIRPY